jgi:hypothetical protein
VSCNTVLDMLLEVFADNLLPEIVARGLKAFTGASTAGAHGTLRGGSTDGGGTL